jgi:hypothetical protein
MKEPAFSNTVSVGRTTRAAALVASGLRANVNDRHLRQLRGGDARGREILVDRDHCANAAGVDASRQIGQRGRRQFLDQSGHERSAYVRVTVRRDQQSVALRGAADELDRSLQRVCQSAGEILFLDRAPARADDGNAASVRAEKFSRRLQRGFQRALGAVDLERGKAVIGPDLLVKLATAVGHPGVVDGVVAARGDAVDHTFARPHDRVRARARLGVDAVRLLQEPDAHLEPEIRRS